MNESTKWLYEKLSSHGYNVGASADIFDSLMVNNPESRKWAYNTAQKHGYNVGEYDMFERLVGAMTDGVETTVSGSVVVSPAEAKENADSINQFLENRDTLYTGLQDYDTGIVSGTEQRRRDDAAAEAEMQAEAMRQRLQEDGTIDLMESMKEDAREAKRKTRREAIRYGLMAAEGVAPQDVDLTSMATEHRQNKLLQEKLDVALDMARAGEVEAEGLLGFGAGLGLGIWDSATRLSTWDMGFSDIANNATLQQIVEKWENDPSSLTATEKKVLDGIGMATAVQELYSDQVGVGYNVGQSLPESAGFMASMALNPASGLGKSLARNAVRTYGRNSIAKNLARIGGDIAETAIMTATTGAGRVAADALERINGSSTYEIGENGVIMYGGQKDQETVGNAVIKAIGSNFIENYSEALGEYFDPLLGMSRKVAAGGLRKMHLDKWADALSDVQPSQMTASIRALREKAKFGGILGEIMEEEVGMALNTLFVGDNQWSDFVDLETQLTTVLSCAIMSGTLNGVEQVSSVAARRKMEKNAKNAEQEALYRFSSDKFAPLREAIDQASPEGMVDVLRDVYMSQEYTVGQKRALAEYAAARLQLQYYNAADAKARRQVNKTQQELLDAQEAGLNAQLPQFFNIARAVQNAEDDLVDYDGDWNLVEIIRSSMNRPEEMERILGDLPPREAQLVTNYIYSRARMEGAYQGRSNRAEDYVDDFAYALEPAVVTDAEGNRTITTALLGDRSVYVLDNNGDLAHIMRPDGSKTLVKASELTNITTSSADEVIDRYRDMYTFEYNAETENAFEHHPKTQAPQVGLQLQSPEGEVVITAINDNMVEIVPAVYKDGQVQPKEGAEPRTITVDDAYAWQDDYYLSMDADQAYANAMAEANNMSAETAENEGTPTEEIEQSVSEEVADGQNGDTVGGSPVALSYLLEGGQGSIENAGYFLHGVAAAFPSITNDIEAIRNSMDSAVLGMRPMDFVSSRAREIDAIRDLVLQTYGDEGVAIYNELLANASGFVPKVGAALGQRIESLAETLSQPTETEGVAPVAPAAPQTARERVPKDEKGNPIYEQTDADTAWDAIVEETEGDTEMAQRVAADMLEDKKASLAKLQNGKPKKGATVAEKIANEKVHQAAIAQAQNDVAQWEAIVGTEARRREAAMSEADRYAAEMEQKSINEGLAALGEPQSLEEYVLGQLAGGAYKLRWSDKENGTKGFGSHTGLSTEEMKARLSMIDNKNGLTPEEIAHSIVENMDASFGEVDVMDVTNMVIDAVSTHASRRAMLNGMVESRAELIRQQEIAEQEAKDAWYMEQYHATEEELAAYSEYLAEITEEIIADDANYEERFNTFAELIADEYDNQGTDADIRSSADQGEGLASDREGSSSVGEGEETDRQGAVLGDAPRFAEAEDGRAGSSVSAESDVDFTREELENGDVRITNRNSNGEIATVAIERDGNVISVDTYDDGALFEHTDYDSNGNATKVTRYKDGKVVSEQEYKDGKRKVTANVFEMAEEAQKNRKSNKKSNDTARRSIQESPAEADRVSGEIFGGESLGKGESVSARSDGGILEEGAGKKKRTAKARRQSDNRQEARDGKAERLSRGISPVQQQAIDEYTRTNPWDANFTDDERGVLSMYRMATLNELDDLAHKLADKINSGKAIPRDRMRYDVLAAYAKSGELKAVADAMGVEYGKPVSLDTIKSLFETFNSDADLAKLFDRVFPLVKNINPTIIYRRFTEADIEEGEDVLPDDILGQYSLQENLIEYNRNQIDSNHCTEQEKASTIVHEMIHAVARYAIRVQEAHNKGVELDIQLPKRLLDAAQSLIEVYDAIKDNEIFNDDRYESGKMYGVSSVHEMLSELADPEFREKLKQVSIENLPSDKRGLVRDALRTIKDFLHRMFGWDSSSAYARTKRALDKLIDNYDSAGYNKARELTDDDFAQQIRPSSEENLRFREKEEPKDGKSLVGLHNISEEKLKKALKMGGLANPSMAVIDVDKQGHEGYGGITLIAPSSLVDKKTGRNIGTYTADAWTPIYPNVEKQMSDKGITTFYKDIDSIPEELRSKVSLYFRAYLEDGGLSGAMYYWFLNDTGRNPEVLTHQIEGYTEDELNAIEAISEDRLYMMNDEQKQKVVDLYIESQGGKEAHDEKIAKRIEVMKNNLQREDITPLMKQKVEKKLKEIQEYGYDYNKVSEYFEGAKRNLYYRGKVNETDTFRNAENVVKNEGLQQEFNDWLSNKEDKYGVKEYIFVGYNNNGDRKYIPNTLENASKVMRKEGRAGATGLSGFNKFIAILAPNAGSLAQIRKKKGNLSTEEEYQNFRDKWGDVYHELAQALQPDANGYSDYGYYRLEEMPTVSNPKQYVKKEYGVELTDEFMQKYNDFVSAVKNDFPARYFETKFERPVYLNEFAAAVVPTGTSQEVMDALKQSGLEVVEYEQGNEEARTEAVRNITNEIENIRFRDGAPFFSNAERAVEIIKQNKATPEQWLAMIKKDGGLKAGEDKWMGLSDWLNEQKEKGVKTLTKDEVLAFIRENQIEIEEVEYGDIENNSRFKDLNDEYRELYYEYGHNGDAAFEEMVSRYGDDFELAFSHSGDELVVEDTFGSEAAEYFLGVRSIDATRRGYTTDGLVNKQEIALVVPTIDSWNRSDIIHFGDAGEGRAVAWVRFGETIDEDGNRVLVIDEVQSKRHDEGRAKGYKQGVPSRTEAYRKLQDIESSLANKYGDEFYDLESDEEIKGFVGEEDFEVYASIRDEYIEVRRFARENNSRVPDAPFDKNYHELVMKRMLRYAAENGFDKVAWNTGKQVAKRFGLSSRVSSIEYKPLANGHYNVTAYGTNGYPIEGVPVVYNNEQEIAETFGRGVAEKIVNDIEESKKTLKETNDALRELKERRKGLDEDSEEYEEIMEEYARLFALQDEANSAKSIEGEDLSIGGDDRVALYDEMIPRFMNKYTKKWGTKVGEVTLPNVEKAGRTMWSVDVTPEMRESVMQGQPMFREGMGAISDREVSYENDPIAKFQGKPRYYGKRAAAFAERERRRMENAAKEAAEMLGIEAEIVTDASTLQGRKAKAKGWYDIVNKKVVVVVPNHVSMGDAVRTVLHEGVAHHGLRELFGDGFDTMLDNVYNNVAPELKARIDAIAERTGVSTQVATEEYLASLAETTNFEEAQRRGWWAKIKQYFVKMLDKLGMPGLKLKEELTDNELRYLLWRSYKNLVEPNSYAKPLGFAEDVVKQKELKVGEYAEKAPATPMAAEMSEAEEWAAVTVQRIDELEAQAAQLENEIAEMEADRDADDASRYEMWEQQLEPLRKHMEDVYAELEGLYSLEAEAEEMSMASEDAVRFRLVDDPEVIAELEASPKRTGYRNVVLNEDGTFSSPMAYWLQSINGGAKTRVEMDKFELGQWEEAQENIDLVDENGHVALVKPDKGTVKVAYDPYIHNRLEPVNLQFKDAWKRDDLVYVETEVAETDLNSGYHAEKAKLPVGIHSWSNGDVMLSKYDKPVRIMPWEEVADAWADRLNGEGVNFDRVPKAMRSLLEERGVEILPPTKNMGKDCNDAYKKWREENPKKERNYTLSNKKDNEGNVFFETNGSIDLWNISSLLKKARRQDAPIRLTDANMKHIIDSHKAEIGGSEKDVFRFLDNVFSNAYTLRKAKGRAMFVVVEKTNTDKAAIIKLYPSNYGDYYNVESAGYYRKDKWKNTEEVIAELSEPTLSDTASDVSKPQASNNSGRMPLNAETATISADKVSNNSSAVQEKNVKSRNSEEIVSEVKREAAALGVPVRIARSVDELPDEDTRKRAVDGQLKGYFDPRTGEVVVYEPNTNDANDAKRTILHEIVGHKGLRQLIGEQQYDKAMVQLMYMLSSEVRDAVLRRAERHGWNAAIAMDEYLAEQAERDVQPTWWGKVNAMIRALLRNMGFNVMLTDADVTYLLWRSRKKLQGDSLNDMAVNAILKQAARKSAEAEAWNEQAFKDMEMRDFERNALPSIRHRMGADTNDYEKTMRTLGFKQSEAWQDSMRSLLVFQQALAKASGKDIFDFENAYMYENRMSSANLMEMEQYRHMVYNPLLKEIHELEQMGASRESIINYLFAKSGLERNEVFARRDAKKHAEGDATKEQQLYDKYRQKDYAGLTALTRGDAQIAALVDDHSKKKTEYERLEQNKKRGVAVSDADLKAAKKEMDDARKAMTTAIETEAQRMVDEFERAHNTDNLWDKIHNCTHTTLNISHDAGVMSDEVYNELWNQFQYYIPLRGFADTTAEDVYLYLGGSDSPYNAPIKTAYGRTSLADDPIATIGNMAESAIVEANRNRLKQRFLYMVERHNTDLASISDVWLEYDDVNDEWHTLFAQIPDDATPSEAKRLQQEFEDRMKQLSEQNPGKYANASQQPNIPYRVVKKGDRQEHHVIVKRNGKDVVITINGNPRVAQAINGLTNPEQNQGMITRITSWINRNLSANFTMRNPAFMVSNFVRDGFYTNSMVWVKENPAYAWQYNQNWMKCTAQIASLVSRYKRYEKGDTSALDMNNDMDRMFYEFMINGGETGYTVIKSVEDYKGLISGEMKKMEAGAMGTARRVSDTIGSAIDTFGRWAEDTSRFAAYMTSRQLGRTITKSIWDAKEISVNFNKKGSGNRMMGKFEHGNRWNYVLSNMSQLGRNLYVFWNAGMQGLNNFSKAAKKSPAKFTAMAGTYFTLGVIVAAAFSGDDDEDDYYNLPEYVRRNNICFKIGKGKYATLPLPIEIRAIYGLGELAYSYLSGREGLTHGEAVTKTIQQITQIMPIDMMADGGGAMALVPSAAKPVVEVAFNVDWTGRPIYKEKTPWNQNDPTWTLAFKSTSPELVQMSRLVNEWTNKNTADGLERPYNRGWADNRYLNNPAVWEHIAEGYLGGVATMFNQSKKTLMMPFNEDLREVRNVPIASRFIKDAGKEGRSYAARNEYYDAKNIMDSWKNEMSKAKKEVLDESLTDEQRLKAAKLRSSLEQQYMEAAERWKVLDRQRRALEEAYKNDQSEDNRQALDDVMMQMATLVEAYRD